jgi:hypothetical protein
LVVNSRKFTSVSVDICEQNLLHLFQLTLADCQGRVDDKPRHNFCGGLENSV